MTLVDLVLGVMLSLHASPTPSAPSTDATQERLRPVALAIAEAAEESPLWDGPHAVRDTALDLAVIAAHESGYRDSVRTCQKRGDGGRSIGLYQLNGRWAWSGYTADEICQSDTLQAALALRALRRHWARGVRTRSALYRAYASGDAGKPSRAARDLETMFSAARARASVLDTSE